MYETAYAKRCKKSLARVDSPSLLSDSLELIGRGSGRLCYQHPFDKALCIKIPRAVRGANESLREYRYIKRINALHREDTSRHVTPFYGRICTTIGPGWVAERVLDEDGVTASPLLCESLTEESFEANSEKWTAAFDEFRHWCARTAVVVRDASVNNICVRRLANGNLRFVLIDGIGPRGLMPRLLPLKSYAYRRNLVHAENSEFTSIENLVVFCAKLRNDLQYHRDVVVDLPTEPVRCLKRLQLES